MKKIKLLFVLLTIGNLVYGVPENQGIQFSQGTWSEILDQAQREEKLIFVDFYASWCGPCVWMTNDVFTDEYVGEFFNKNFINVSIDAEYEMEWLVEEIDLEAYPTLVIFSGSGDILTKNVGALDTEELINFGRNALNGPEIEINYISNPNDYKNVKDYANLIVDENPDKASDIVEIYLREQSEDELTSQDSWYLIRNFLIDYRSEEFQRVYGLSDQFIFHDEFEYYMLSDILGKMIHDASKDMDTDLLQESIELEINIRELTGNLEFEPDYYIRETSYIYAYNTKDFSSYFDQIDSFVRIYFWDDLDQLTFKVTDVAEEIYNLELDSSYYDVILAWSDRSIQIDNKAWESYFSKAYIYYMMDEYQKAKNYGKKALKYLDDESLKTDLLGFIELVSD